MSKYEENDSQFICQSINNNFIGIILRNTYEMENLIHIHKREKRACDQESLAASQKPI